MEENLHRGLSSLDRKRQLLFGDALWLAVRHISPEESTERSAFGALPQTHTSILAARARCLSVRDLHASTSAVDLSRARRCPGTS